MHPLSQFSDTKIKFLFSDIDDTMTDEGKLGAAAYDSLWRLHDAGIKVVPVTGRPAGWCEMIARQWPVAGVVGENGGLYFLYDGNSMRRHYAVSERSLKKNRTRLDKVVAPKILRTVRKSKIASDQFGRIFDLAIDFAEDVKPALKSSDVQKIVEIFEKFGAQAKVSSIHVNGWFGKYNKLSMCQKFLKREFKMDLSLENARCAFVGDSPNDEPMFEFFKNSFGVANIKDFADQIEHLPKFISHSEGGQGFKEVADVILKNLNP